MGAIPVVLGVVSVFKAVGMDAKWAPVVSLVLGLALSFFAGGATMIDVILGGLVVGLSASGLYSSTKATVRGFSTE